MEYAEEVCITYHFKLLFIIIIMILLISEFVYLYDI